MGSVVKGAFHQLRLLAKAKAYLSLEDLERVVHAFITSRLDYCNSLYAGLDQLSLQSLQLEQNAAARLLTCTKKRDHFAVLVSLRWLPVCFRVNFKVLFYAFQILHDLVPPLYLAELLHVRTPARALRLTYQ